MKKSSYSLVWLFVCLLFFTSSYAQVLELNEPATTESLSQQLTVLEWLVGEQPAFSDDAAALLTGKWEALAYVDLARAPSLEEAVPDVYTFNVDSTYSILFFQQLPDAPQVNATGTFVLKKQQLALYLDEFPGRVFQEMAIWFVSEEYLVLEMDELRIFFVHPK